LPLGAWLCFTRGWGAFGLWAGLSLALILIGIVLLVVWRRSVSQLAVSISQTRNKNARGEAWIEKNYIL